MKLDDAPKRVTTIDLDNTPKTHLATAAKRDVAPKRARSPSTSGNELKSKKSRDDPDPKPGPSRVSDSDNDFRPSKKIAQARSDSDDGSKNKKLIDLKKVKGKTLKPKKFIQRKQKVDCNGMVYSVDVYEVIDKDWHFVTTEYPCGNSN